MQGATYKHAVDPTRLLHSMSASFDARSPQQEWAEGGGQQQGAEAQGWEDTSWQQQQWGAQAEAPAWALRERDDGWQQQDWVAQGDVAAAAQGEVAAEPRAGSAGDQVPEARRPLQGRARAPLEPTDEEVEAVKAQYPRWLREFDKRLEDESPWSTLAGGDLHDFQQWILMPLFREGSATERILEASRLANSRICLSLAQSIEDTRASRERRDPVRLTDLRPRQP